MQRAPGLGKRRGSVEGSLGSFRVGEPASSSFELPGGSPGAGGEQEKRRGGAGESWAHMI
jgi:hypothetical protein